MAADPNWPEIKNALFPGQTPSDRPDLVCSAFYAKSQELIYALIKDKVPGKILAYILTIEFQKLGLPHMHMITCLHPSAKLQTPEDVDSFISAEFPDPDTEPELHELVKTYMVHGPCGDLNPNSPCMENGKCSKNFPKPFRDCTTLSEDGYASYRWQDDGRQHEVRGCQVDNCWVVPYSPYLLFRFQCHLNVECIASMKCFKYIHKYIYKGHDHTTMGFGTCKDEPKQYLDACFVSAHEGCWRLFMFAMHQSETVRASG
jgi:hypothetical protein